MKNNIDSQSQSGFTIIELMITVTVAGILAAIAIPSFGDLVKNNRLASQTNSVMTSLHYARGEAVSKGTRVRLEPLVANSADWSAGWLARIDGNNDGDFADAEDIVLRNFEGLKSSTLTIKEDNGSANGVAVDTSADEEMIVYKSDGIIEVNGNINRRLDVLADECTKEHKRVIKIKMSGQAWLDQNDRACP